MSCIAPGLTIRVILARDLQYGGESSLVPIDDGSDLVRDLEDRRQRGRNKISPLLPYRIGRECGPHVLVDQEDGDIRSLCEFLERRFDDRRRCFYKKTRTSQNPPDWAGNTEMHELSKTERTTIDDQKVLLLLVIHMSDPGQ